MIIKSSNLKKIVCLIKDDKKDVARNHDKYLAEAINTKPRKGWAKQFKKMHKNKEDKLLIDDSLDIDDLLE